MESKCVAALPICPWHGPYVGGMERNGSAFAGEALPEKPQAAGSIVVDGVFALFAD